MTHDIRPFRRKSIDELEGISMRPPYRTGMIERIARSRGIAIEDLEPKDLRLLVSQGVALSYLWPLALERLEARPLLSAELYLGDLLCAALHADARYGATAEHRARLRQITARALEALSLVEPTDWSGAAPHDPDAPDEVDRDALEPKLRAALERMEGTTRKGAP
jgi:hypothetical protein